MFATLIGAYPATSEPKPADEAVGEVVEELAAAGLEPLSDGRGAERAASSDDVARIVAAWRHLIWAAHYAASIKGRGLVRVGLANASSLEGISRERARAKVQVLASAAQLAADASPDELAAPLDPRAVDIRSAAVGRYTPRRK